MSADLQVLSDYIASSLGDAIEDRAIAYGELTLVARRDDIVRVITFLRDDPQCRFVCFVDICGADYPAREQRFDVVYHLLSPYHNTRIRVKAQTDEVTPVPSLIGVFPAANWFEREAYDLYGILFSGHPDLRRLLTDYGFEGHPLRKDFPLLRAREAQSGIPQLRLPLALGRHGLRAAG
jgi:NADH-quinone oxidoreductase subunit C